MKNLSLVYGPDPIFKKTADPVTLFDEDLKEFCDSLTAMLYSHHAVGIAAPMVGELKRVIAYDLQENGNNPMVMINPVITNKSKDTQTFEEGSICFPGVSAEITRPKEITVSYQTPSGEQKTMSTDGWLATIIQHEMDYLDGVTIFDYLTPMKRKMLFKKTKKFRP